MFCGVQNLLILAVAYSLQHDSAVVYFYTWIACKTRDEKTNTEIILIMQRPFGGIELNHRALLR